MDWYESAVGDDLFQQPLPSLVLGIPTVPRPKGASYLEQTLQALLPRGEVAVSFVVLVCCGCPRFVKKNIPVLHIQLFIVRIFSPFFSSFRDIPLISMVKCGPSLVFLLFFGLILILDLISSNVLTGPSPHTYVVRRYRDAIYKQTHTHTVLLYLPTPDCSLCTSDNDQTGIQNSVVETFYKSSSTLANGKTSLFVSAVQQYHGSMLAQKHGMKPS